MVKVKKIPSEEELELVALCLTQGYTGVLIKYINTNNLDNETNIKDLIRNSIKYCLYELNEGRSLESVYMVNETIGKLLKWYKNRI